MPIDAANDSVEDGEEQAILDDGQDQSGQMNDWNLIGSIDEFFWLMMYIIFDLYINISFNTSIVEWFKPQGNCSENSKTLKIDKVEKKFWVRKSIYFQRF